MTSCGSLPVVAEERAPGSEAASSKVSDEVYTAKEVTLLLRTVAEHMSSALAVEKSPDAVGLDAQLASYDPLAELEALVRRSRKDDGGLASSVALQEVVAMVLRHAQHLQQLHAHYRKQMAKVLGSLPSSGEPLADVTNRQLWPLPGLAPKRSNSPPRAPTEGADSFLQRNTAFLESRDEHRQQLRTLYAQQESLKFELTLRATHKVERTHVALQPIVMPAPLLPPDEIRRQHGVERASKSNAV